MLLPDAAHDPIAAHAALRDFIADAWGHAKVIGFVATARPLLSAAGVPVPGDAGLVPLAPGGASAFVQRAKAGRIWAREATVRPQL